MPDDPIQYLLDKSDVSDAVKRYFIALDRFDWNTVASLVADEFYLETDAPGAASHPVPRDEFMRTLKERNGGFTGTIHLNPGHLVEVEGDKAKVTAHMWAAHSVGSEPSDTFWGFGLYEFELQRSASGWQLSRQRIDLVGAEGGSPPDIFARSAERQASGLGHY